MLNRAYSVVEVKAFDEELREIRGIATHPSPDRENDCVVPEGIQVAQEIPLLLRHKTDQPVGVARLGRPTKAGMPFVATMPKIVEEGSVRDLVESAWTLVKYGLTRGCSIGFRVLEAEKLPSGGLRFLRTEILELSLVEIPAHQNATILTVRDFDIAGRSTPVTGQEEQFSPVDATRNAQHAQVDAPIDTTPASIPPSTRTEKIVILDKTTAPAIIKSFMDAARDGNLDVVDDLICSETFEKAVSFLARPRAERDFLKCWEGKRTGPNGSTGKTLLYTQDLHETLVETLKTLMAKTDALDRMLNAHVAALRIINNQNGRN